MSRQVVSTLVVTLAAGLSGGCSDSDPERPQNFLLISIDTLRAASCGAYGYDKPTTPFLDELAEQGVLFEAHMSNSNNTLISHASILTGLSYAKHGTYDGGRSGVGRPLALGYKTLAEAFQEAGYSTAAFTAHPSWLGDKWGLDQGFARLDSEWWNAPQIRARYLEWLADREQQGDSTANKSGWFAFLHFYDVHSELGSAGIPYQSTPELVAEFAGESPAGFTGCTNEVEPRVCGSRYLRAITRRQEPLPEEHREYLLGLYDAGVRKMDEELRELFAELEEGGHLDDTLVVITSDHGEEFREHGRMLHDGVGDEVMRVPLIIVPPRDFRPFHRRVRDVTQSIDIAATVLDLAGLQPIGEGRSLLPAMVDGSRVPATEVLFNDYCLRAEEGGVRFKYSEEENHEALYDLDRDPDELRNMLEDPDFMGTSGERVERMRARLDELQAEGARLVELVSSDARAPEMSPDEIEMLEKLGYTSESP